VWQLRTIAMSVFWGGGGLVLFAMSSAGFIGSDVRTPCTCVRRKLTQLIQCREYRRGESIYLVTTSSPHNVQGAALAQMPDANFWLHGPQLHCTTGWRLRGCTYLFLTRSLAPGIQTSVPMSSASWPPYFESRSILALHNAASTVTVISHFNTHGLPSDWASQDKPTAKHRRRFGSPAQHNTRHWTCTSTYAKNLGTCRCLKLDWLNTGQVNQ
jgi:hypothetical protein